MLESENRHLGNRLSDTELKLNIIENELRLRQAVVTPSYFYTGYNLQYMPAPTNKQAVINTKTESAKVNSKFQKGYVTKQKVPGRSQTSAKVKSVSDCYQDIANCENDCNESVICIEDSGENQKEIKQNLNSNQKKKCNKQNIAEDKGKNEKTIETIDNVHRNDELTEEPDVSLKNTEHNQSFLSLTQLQLQPHGIRRKSHKTSFREYKNFNTNLVFLETLLNDYQIVAVQEHWLYGFEKGKLIDFCEKQWFSTMIKSSDDNDPLTPLQRPRGKGGVALLLSKCLDKHVTILDQEGGTRVCVIQVETHAGPVTTINCYLPCRGNKEADRDFMNVTDDVREIVVTYKQSSDIILLGDMNASMFRDPPLPRDKYEGDSICNEIVPINQKVLYLYALQLHSQKGLLLGYTTAKSQLFSSFTTLHNPLSRKGTKLHCDTNLSSGFQFRILYELSLFSVCLFVW